MADTIRCTKSARSTSHGFHALSNLLFSHLNEVVEHPVNALGVTRLK